MLVKPGWLTIRVPNNNERILQLRDTLRKHNLVTVCEEAHCPNIPECWNGGTATFMIMGDKCTRGCRFCNVATSAKPAPLDENEPVKLADAASSLELDYIVITSVDRDDLPDQGAGHFARCIKTVKEKTGALVEVLIPDFRGNAECLGEITDAQPLVIAHNVETVRRLQGVVRDRRANYEQSLAVLRNAKALGARFTKSSIMVGIGETDGEVIETMKDLLAAGVDFLTIGQYLRPSQKHLEITRYVEPEKFEFYRKIGEELGFKYVASGPFVRSSYRAGELFIKSMVK